jgi:hypothetical protein
MAVSSIPANARIVTEKNATGDTTKLDQTNRKIYNLCLLEQNDFVPCEFRRRLGYGWLLSQNSSLPTG